MKTAVFKSAAMLLVFGCTSVTAPPDKFLLSVTKLEAPATVAAGSPIDVVLTLEIGGCQTFDEVRELRFDASVELTVFGKPLRGCPGQRVVETRAYRIDAPSSTGSFGVGVYRGALLPLIAYVDIR